MPPIGPQRRLLFVGAYPAEGSARNLSASGELAAQLEAAGWSIGLVSRRDRGVVRLLDIALTMLRRRSEVDLVLIDVFSGAALRWAEVAAWIARRSGVPYVLTLHGGNLPAQMSRTPGRLRALFGGARAVVAPSAYLATALAACGVAIQVIPNGFDLTRYPFRPRRRAQPSLVWLRAIHAIYNPVMAVRTVASLRQTHPTVTLDMLGPVKDDSLTAVRSAIDDAGLAQVVRLRGGIPKAEVPDALSAHDVFINTTNVDNAPVSVIEAMAAGLCVVTTNVGGLPFLCTDGEDALLVPADDSEAMAAAVRRLVDDPALAERLSVGGRRTAERAAWPAVVSAWDTLIQTALGKSAR